MAAGQHLSDDEDSTTCNVLSIDELQNHGIGAADISKLKLARILTIGLCKMTPSRKLLNIKGFSELKVEKIKEAVAKALPPTMAGFTSAIELKQERKKVFQVSTGCKAFDAMLGGGVHSNSITQVYGEYRCGKTQLSHTLCVMAQLPKDMGGAEGKVVFINTEGTFRPARISQIAERFGMDGDAALENISYARCADTESQMNLVENLAELFQNGEYRLLVIDSIIALYRVEFLGRGELADRQQALSRLLNHCTKLATEFNVAVFIVRTVICHLSITNIELDEPSFCRSRTEFSMYDTGPPFGMKLTDLVATGPKPVGGHIVSHASATIIALRKGRGEERVAKLIDSPDVPEGDCVYVIGPARITDSDGK